LASFTQPQGRSPDRMPAPAPLVSTVIPTYRRAEMVSRAVQTVLTQNYPNIEVIVVDDNREPTEQRRVREALAPFGARVTVVPNERAKGACGARNTGILHARGELIRASSRHKSRCWRDASLLPHYATTSISMPPSVMPAIAARAAPF
jgi:glycosyltransferase involved in cell wall biosynthesis